MNILRYAGVLSLALLQLAAARAASEETPFRRHGADLPESFAAVNSSLVFDVVDSSSDYWMIQFDASPGVTVEPKLLRLAPGERRAVTLHLDRGADATALTYALARSSRPFVTHANRYRAYSDGETEGCIPVAAAGFAAMRARTATILQLSETPLTDPAMPPGTQIYTAGPFYKAAGLFGRDFLFQLEGAGREFVSADSVRAAVDYQASKQLTANRKLGAFTYPKGAIPDHIYPDGRYCWGPGLFYGDDTAHFHRPSMDQAFCFVLLGWHYGYKAGWDDRWKRWFGEKAQRFGDAWGSVPLNPRTGLVTQWSTPGHVGASGITETNGSSVSWGFHDSYGLGGDDLGCSILACNAARALADMYEHAGNPAECEQWAQRSAAMQTSVQARFDPRGFLPWGLGPNAPTMASPDYTGYAIWSGILTEAQADRASDWFAERYRADRAAGGAADLFNMAAPFRGAVRMARKADDVSPGRHVWPDMRDGNNWENLTFGYNAYQDGGYWYYKSLGVAIALSRKHPDLAREWVGNAYADLNTPDPNPPYERIDGLKPVNNRYNASVGQLFGMGVPAEVAVVKVRREARSAAPSADRMGRWDLGQVKVGGELGRRIDLTVRGNLMKIDLDKDFIAPFVGGNYTGLNDGSGPFIGIGKTLDGMVHLAAYTHDQPLLARTNHLVDAIIHSQHPDGYIGMMAAENRTWTLWDLHEQAFLLTGLVSDAQLLGRQDSLAAAIRLADYVIKRWPTQPADWEKHLPIHSFFAELGLSYGFLTLYEKTGDERYLDFVSDDLKEDAWNLAIVRGRKPPVDGHTYMYLSHCLAQLELYRLRPNPALLVPTDRAVKFMTAQDGMTITGGTGEDECWNDEQEGDKNLGETCSTAYQIFVFDSLLRLRGDSSWGDLIERNLYNAAWGAQSEDGRQIRYYTPFEGPRVYFKPDSYCCPGNFRRLMGLVPQLIYYRARDGVAVNLYTDSELTVPELSGVPVMIAQSTDYPTSGKATVLVSPQRPADFALYLRVPQWSTAPVVAINGTAWAQPIQSGQFLRIERRWRKGDQVTVDWGMDWRFVTGRKDQAGRAAIMRGPMVYSLDPQQNPALKGMDLKQLVLDPATATLGADDGVVRPGGTVCRISGRLGGAQARPVAMTFTEFADPNAEATYFKIADPRRLVADELLGGAGAAAKTAGSAPQVQTLSGGWKLAPDPNNVGLGAHWYEAVRPEAQPAPVPGIIQQVFPAYHGVAWYWRPFRAPAPQGSDQVYLRFGAVDYRAEVWVNGIRAGAFEGGETPFEFNVTGSIHPEEENVVAVRVLNPTDTSIDGITLTQTPHRNKSLHPRSGSSFDSGGIIYPVDLRTVPAVHVEDLFVRADPATGRVSAQVTVANDGPADQSGALALAIAGASGGDEIERTAQVGQFPPGISRQEIALDVAQPHPWNLDDPYLYRVTVTLTAAGQKPHQQSVRTGFRDFRVVAGRFVLNGKQLFLKSTHTGNHMPIGQQLATVPDFVRRDLINAKASGFNTVRFIAGTAYPEQLDFCDELGLLVYEECYASWLLGDSPQMAARFDHSTSSMILRDRNHPSIAIWGLLNETKDGAVYRHAEGFLPEARRLDPTRVVLLSSGRWDGHWSVGSVSNPGGTVWEPEWGVEGPGVAGVAGPRDMGNNLGYAPGAGDVHSYPTVPQTPATEQFFRDLGRESKPVFISEYGIGSMMDAIGAVRQFEQAGARDDLEDSAWLRRQGEAFAADWQRLGFGDVYPFPEDLLRESQRLTARQRRRGFDLIRSNPQISGYSLSGMLDQGYTGEGLWTFWRTWKPETFDVVAAGWAPLRWSLLPEALHVYAGRPVHLVVALANEGVLKAGDYPARLRLIGPQGLAWEASPVVRVTDPKLLALPVVDTAVTIHGPAGKYTLGATLERGGDPAAEQVEIDVSDPAALPRLSGTAATWGLSSAVTAWLVHQGLTVHAFTGADSAQDQLILIGQPSEPLEAAPWQQLKARIHDGATAEFLAPELFIQHPEALAWLPFQNHGRCYRFADWMYHKECVARRHVVFDGLPGPGIMDPDYYGQVIPHEIFEGTDTPDDTMAAAFSVGYYGYPDGYGYGILMGAWNHGAGRIVLNAPAILDCLDHQPAADRLMVNLVAYGQRRLATTS